MSLVTVILFTSKHESVMNISISETSDNPKTLQRTDNGREICQYRLRAVRTGKCKVRENSMVALILTVSRPIDTVCLRIFRREKRRLIII